MYQHPDFDIKKDKYTSFHKDGQIYSSFHEDRQKCPKFGQDK